MNNIKCCFCLKKEEDGIKLIVKDSATAICNECTLNALKLFLQNGIEMKIDIEITS